MQLQADARLCLGAVIGFVVLYLFGWSVYLLNLPPAIFRLLIPMAVLATLWRRGQLMALLKVPAVRQLAFSWVIVASWCLGLLALIRNYSGGEWVSDWFEHYHRTLFFLNRLPLDTRFLNMYPLPARPPLANVVLGDFLAVTSSTFAHYQIFTTLLSSLAFFPLALLARCFCRASTRDPAAFLAILLMLNPMFVQNATFAWTKLPAAFFVLSGLYFSVDATRAQSRTISFCVALCLSASLLTHYSAAPYLLAFSVIWFWRMRQEVSPTSWMRSRIPAISIAAALLATWFAWALFHYGRVTISATTTFGAYERLTAVQQVIRRGVNFFNLVVPHPLRPAEYSYLTQDSALGLWRDHFFNLYQSNLLFAFGSGGMVVLAVLLWRHRKRAISPWGCFVAIVLFLNAAVISWPDRWGSAHIGLQPLILIGLTWIAAAMPELGPKLRCCLIGGLAVDTALGIALHFYFQHMDLALDFPNYRDQTLIHLRGYATWVNYVTKAAQHLTFLGDRSIQAAPLCTVLALLLALAIYQANSACPATDRVPTSSGSEAGLE